MVEEEEKERESHVMRVAVAFVLSALQFQAFMSSG